MAIPSQTAIAGNTTGSTACHGNAQFYCIDDLIQVHMTRNDLIIGTYDTDQRTVPSLPLSIPSALNRDLCGACCIPFFTLSLLIVSYLHLYDARFWFYTRLCNQISHLYGSDFCASFRHDIACAVSVFQYLLYRCFDRICLFIQIQVNNAASWQRKGS